MLFFVLVSCPGALARFTRCNRRHALVSRSRLHKLDSNTVLFAVRTFATCGLVWVRHVAHALNVFVSVEMIICKHMLFSLITDCFLCCTSHRIHFKTVFSASLARHRCPLSRLSGDSMLRKHQIQDCLRGRVPEEAACTWL